MTDARALGEPHVVPEVAIVAAFLNQPEVALDALSADMRSAGVDLAWVWRTPPLATAQGAALSRAAQNDEAA